MITPITHPFQRPPANPATLAGMTLLDRFKLALTANRILKGQATPKDQTTMLDLIRKYAGPTVRHSLTAASGFLVARGLPGLTAAATENLTEVTLAGLVLLATLAWSYAEKALRPKA